MVPVLVLVYSTALDNLHEVVAHQIGNWDPSIDTVHSGIANKDQNTVESLCMSFHQDMFHLPLDSKKNPIASKCKAAGPNARGFWHA